MWILVFDSLERMVVLMLSLVLALSVFEQLRRIPRLEASLQISLAGDLLGLWSNALLVLMLVWKLAPGVFRFAEVLETPILLLYAPGGLPGFLLGLAAALGALLPLTGARKEAWKKASSAGTVRILVWILMILGLSILLLWLLSMALEAWNASRLNPPFLK